MFSKNKIHSTAIIGESVVLGKNIEIGPYSIINDNVKIGNDTKIRSNVIIDTNVDIGNECDIFPFASIGLDPQGYDKKDPNAKLIIGNKNIIRECVTISIGSVKDKLITRIGNNCLFMAYSHVAHDCILGDNIVLANNVSLAGHVVLESNVIMGGHSAVHQFSKIGQNAMIGAFSFILKDVLPFTMYVTVNKSDNFYTTGIQGINIVGLKRCGFDKKDILSLINFYNNFLNNENNETEHKWTLLEKYNKYEYLILNSDHKNIIKNFINKNDKRGFYRELLKVRNIIDD